MKKLSLSIIVALLTGAAAFAQSQEVRFFSHRGGRMEYDENTLSAFEASYKAGYRGYETDIRMTKDGKLVILHDSNLVRTTDTEGVVEQMTEAQIRQARTKKGNKVLFLDELMDSLTGLGILSFCKSKGFYSKDKT